MTISTSSAEASQSQQETPKPRRRKLLLLALGTCLTAFLLGCVARGPVCWPFDLMWNMGGVVEAEALSCPEDGKVRVVFLQHGMWRTSMALNRLERALRHNGYEVINTGYSSTNGYLSDHAKRLRDVVEERAAKGPIDEISFVGHSMGGVVIHEYLRRPDSREPKACVYIAVPQRGAILVDIYRNWFLYDWIMGEKASHQLATVDPIQKLPIPYGDRSGAIVGDLGDSNSKIPGHDDGTVGVSEATFEGLADSVLVPFGHTRIIVADQVLRQVMHFLLSGKFADDEKSG